MASTTSSNLTEDADFGPIRITTSTQMTGRAMLESGSSLATGTCLNIAARMLITMAYFGEADRKPVRLRSIVKSIIEDTGVRFIVVGNQLLDALQSGYFVFAGSELESIMEKIGTELLPSYEYSRTEDLQLFVIKFLLATVTQWGREETMELPYVDKARKLSAWFSGQLLASNIPSYRIRIACVQLLERFLTSKDLTNFGHESEALACRNGEPVTPEDVLIHLLDDADFRVRFRLAPVAGVMCSRIHNDGRQTFAIWTSISESRSFDYKGLDFETNITTLLTYSNIMVASDFFRSNAYHPIIVLAALDASKTTSRFIKAALTASASRLGLTSLAELYTFLAPYTMAEQLYNSQERLLIPDPTAFGFPNKQSLYAARFNETAPMVLAGPRPQFFQDLCAYVGVDEKEALSDIFPTYVAYKFTAGEPGSDVFKLAEQDIAFKAVEVATGTGQQAPDLLRSIRDLVVWRLFSFIWEAEYSANTLSNMFIKYWPENTSAATVLREMLGAVQTPFRPNVLSPPDVRLQAILYALRRSHPATAGALDDEAILYSILHRMLCSVALPPFTSQQLRLLYNTVLCVACSSATLKKSPVSLLMILHRVSALLRQSDLFPVASNVFLWSLYQLLGLRRKANSEMGEEVHFILQAAEAAQDLAAGEAASIQVAAEGLLRKLEECLAENLLDPSKKLVSGMLQARILWPRDLFINKEKPSIEEFENAITHTHGHVGICSALKLLAEKVARAPLTAHPHRIARMLWIALSRLNPSTMKEETSVEVAQVFARLLRLSFGTIEPPALENMSGSGHLQDASVQLAKSQITARLTQLLDDTDLRRVHAAFEVLLSIASIPEEAMPDGGDRRLDMIAAPHIRHRNIKASVIGPSLDLVDLARNPHWLEVAKLQDEWRRDFAAFLAKALGTTQAFYNTLVRLLAENTDFAHKSLPTLVGATLLSGGPAARQNLSAYCESILDTGCPCAVDIIEVILYLRSLKPPQGYTDVPAPLLRNFWLAVPYEKLARSALRDKNYHAALLFVELSRDGNAQPPNLDQELLYDIYGNLEDPDGFYSISSSDLPRGLVRRLHHEGRWLEALSWHGAELEAWPSTGRSSSAPMSAALECLAHGDLGSLAMIMFQSKQGGVSLPQDLLPDLAWKTQSWDIPSPEDTARHHSYSLYTALKASGTVYDHSGSDFLLASLGHEVMQLAGLSQTFPARNPQSLDRILALQEIVHWRNHRADCLATYASETSVAFNAFR